MSAEVRHSTFSVPRSPTENPIRSSRRTPGKDRMPARRFRRANARQSFVFAISAYLREGAISANDTGRFTDADDEADNAYIFGFYVDGELASSVRLHIATKEHPDFPSLHVFPDVLQPLLDAGRVLINSTRFVADEKLSRLHRGLPYATLRPCMLAAEYFHADDLLAAVRVGASGVLSARFQSPGAVRGAALSATGQANQPDVASFSDRRRVAVSALSVLPLHRSRTAETVRAAVQSRHSTEPGHRGRDVGAAREHRPFS